MRAKVGASKSLTAVF